MNWQDRTNPRAGGAEVHLHEIFGRLASSGHEVHLLCSGYAGAVAEAELDGIAVHRVGTRYGFALRGRAAFRSLAARLRHFFQFPRPAQEEFPFNPVPELVAPQDASRRRRGGGIGNFPH